MSGVRNPSPLISVRVSPIPTRVSSIPVYPLCPNPHPTGSTKVGAKEVLCGLGTRLGKDPLGPNPGEVEVGTTERTYMVGSFL